MPPLVRAGLAAALLAALAVMTDRPPRSVRVGAASVPSATGAARLSALCPRGTLPDEGVCVPVPPREPAALEPEPSPGRARTEHDRIERRPDRPADFSKYRLPTELLGGSSVSGTSLPAARGAPVHLVRLEHQEGEAEVLHAGELAGVPGPSGRDAPRRPRRRRPTRIPGDFRKPRAHRARPSRAVRRFATGKSSAPSATRSLRAPPRSTTKSAASEAASQRASSRLRTSSPTPEPSAATPATCFRRPVDERAPTQLGGRQGPQSSTAPQPSGARAAHGSEAQHVSGTQGGGGGKSPMHAPRSKSM